MGLRTIHEDKQTMLFRTLPVASRSWSVVSTSIVHLQFVLLLWFSEKFLLKKILWKKCYPLRYFIHVTNRMAINKFILAVIVDNYFHVCYKFTIISILNSRVNEWVLMKKIICVRILDCWKCTFWWWKKCLRYTLVFT